MQSSPHDEFNWDDFEPDAQTDLAALDQKFLDNIQAKTADATLDGVEDQFTFWFLLMLLFAFVLLATSMVVMLVRARRRRNAYRVVGFLRP